MVQFCRRAQQVMSSTASNYDIRRLNWGIAIATSSLILILETAFEPLVHVKIVGLWIGTITIAYGVIMFASSYVEEEQHFWYWISSAWLGYLIVRQYVAFKTFVDYPLTSSRQAAVVQRKLKTVVASLSLLVALRIIRVWNQTGQKHAGEADIAKTFFPAHNYLLWVLVLATYVNVIHQICRSAIPWASRPFATAASISLGIAALAFKVAFTKADAPELLAGLMQFILPPMDEFSLVVQARAVFLCIGFMISMSILPAAVHTTTPEVVHKSAYLLGLV
ncbi:MAG: hypothetical protein Q9217_003441 [Psora testacea]